MNDPMIRVLEDFERRLARLEDVQTDLARYEVPVLSLFGSGAANSLAVWLDSDTLGQSYALTTVGDLMYMGDGGSLETQEYYDTAPYVDASFTGTKTLATLVFTTPLEPGATIRFDIDVYAQCDGFPTSSVLVAIRRSSIAGTVIASTTINRDTTRPPNAEYHWTATVDDTSAVDTYYITYTEQSAGFGMWFSSSYRRITGQLWSPDPIPARLPIGSEDQFLRVSSGLPVWETVSVATAVSDSSSVDLTLTSGTLSAVVLPGGVDHNALLNYASNRHFLQTDIDHVSTALATGLVTVVNGTGALGSTANNSGNWDTAYGWGNHASAGYALAANVIANSLLTTRGDIIRRGASAPERYGLSVPAAGVLNYLGVANGETDPTWKSASSNPGAAAAILASDASGYLQVVRLGLGVAPTTAALCFAAATTTAGGIEFGADTNLYRSAANTLKTDDAFHATIRFAVGQEGDVISTDRLFDIDGSLTAATSYGLFSSPSIGTNGTLYAFLTRPDIDAGIAASAVYGMSASAPVLGSGASVVDVYGIIIQSQTGGSGKNIGLQIVTPTGGSTNNALWLSGTGGTAASGIQFGTDVNLYRVSSTTLKTDDYIQAVRFGSGRAPQATFDAIADTSITLQAVVHSATTTTDGNFIFVKSHGSTATPAALVTNDVIGSFQFKGYYDGSNITTSKAKIYALANENWSSTNQGTKISFAVTPNASTTLTDIAVIYGDGFVVNENASGVINTRFESATEENMFLLDADGGTDGYLYLGGTTNGIRISKGGELLFLGTATVWKDIDFPIIIRTTGANIPTLAVINGNITMPQWAVNDYNQCESQEFIHEWKEGSTSYWHLHLTTNGLDATNRYVRFEVEYGYVTPSGVWTWAATLDSGDLLIAANTPSKSMFILSLGNFTPTGVEIGGHAVARLKRVASTGTAPTNNPWVPMLQMHVECDTFGSRTISDK